MHSSASTLILHLWLALPLPGQKKRYKRRAIESVGSGIIDSALLVCQDFLDTLEHNDIDISMETPPSLTEQQWAEFLHSYYMIVQ